ncbi:hypothetical protein PIB30_009226 [Stylosanthes scabra]|uniref:Uncharacterized protein n=1 Tax=Stylosanthes scabra TaxID=79078 RepID=A0ABU6Q5A8_9FABA|nr:hypothetical protein [Stylosanthes scabra]
MAALVKGGRRASIASRRRLASSPAAHFIGVVAVLVLLPNHCRRPTIFKSCSTPPADKTRSNGLHRHSCTTCEFTPVTWIYSNPFWDQYLTAGMPRICRGSS